MTADQIVGSAGARFATLGAGVLSAVAFLLAGQEIWPEASRELFVLAIISGILGFVGLLHSFGALYSLWLRFAKRLQATVVILLFGIFYLLLVPVFFLFVCRLDPLRLRTRRGSASFWVRRRQVKVEPTSFERMG